MSRFVSTILNTRETHRQRGIRTQSVLEDPEITSGHQWDGRLSSMQRLQDSQPGSTPTQNPPARSSALEAHLSASTSRGGVPWSQLFTIHAVSKAARKPRAQPVPMGQNGCKKTYVKFSLTLVTPNPLSHSTWNSLVASSEPEQGWNPAAHGLPESWVVVAQI